MTRRLLVAILLMGMVVIPTVQSAPARVPALRQADPVVIGFDDLTTTETGTGGQTVVSDQYADLGVTFNDPKALDYAEYPGFVHSGSNAIQHCYSQEQCDIPLVMTFTEPQRRVKVWVGFEAHLDTESEVQLTAFDAENGGAVIASASATLGPSADPRIPVQMPLEVTTDDSAIRRVEVGFFPASDNASWLVFDDVEFETAAGLLACPSGTAPPTLVLEQPTESEETNLNVFTLQGRVETSVPLEEAELTQAHADGDIRPPVSVLTDLIDPDGGAFGPVVIEDELRLDANTITLSVRNCAGAAEASVSVLYAPPAEGTRYRLLGLEVTQAIQDMNNSVSLIAGKTTYVRVYLRTAEGTPIIHSVSGRLRGCRVEDDADLDCLDSEFAPLEPLNHITVNDSDQLGAQRLNLNNGLMFALPEAWTSAGLVHLQLDEASLSPRLPCDGCENVTDNGGPRTYLFVDAPSVAVDLVDIIHEQGGEPYTPHEVDHMRLESWLERAYPTDEVIVSSLSVLSLAVPLPKCELVNAAMFEAQRIGEIATPSELPDAQARYYGLVAAPAGNAYVGCAGIDESGASINQFAVGPAGFGDDHVWDTDGSYADFYAGHELGHTFLRDHPGACGANAGIDTHYPFELGLLADYQTDFFGFDTGDQSNGVATEVHNPYLSFDVMTYCENIWISSYTYEGILDRMAEELEGPPGLSRLVAPTPDQEVLLVSGTLDLTNKTADLRSFSRLPGDLVSPRPTSSPYTIDLENDAGIEASYPFTPRIYTDQPPPPAPQLAQLAEVVPWDPDTTRIVIREGQTEYRAWRVTINDPQVRLISPNGGERLQGAGYPVTWTPATDRDSVAFTYTLLYSTDGGTTWQTAAGGITDQQFMVDPARLPGSDTARFRIIATDGVNTGQDDSDAVFSVPNKAPQVRIVSPVDAASFTTSHTIVLTGKATDVEQGELDGASMQWSSDIDGALGEGQSISVDDLTAGLHTITLTATDADNLNGAASVELEVVGDPPKLYWDVQSDPVTAQVRQGLFSYDGEAEVGAFYASDGAGGVQHLRTFDVLLNGWSAVVPGNFGGDDSTDLLFYASELGVGEFFATDGNGGLQLLSGNEGFTKGWDLIVPGDFDGQDDWTDLFFYNAEEGEGKFYITDGEGRIRLLSDSETFRKGWTSMVAGDFGGDGHTDLLFYDQSTGLARFYATDGQGGIDLLSGDQLWTAGWDQIVPGNFGVEDGLTDLFFYNAEEGEGKFYTTDGKGGIVPLGSPDSYDSGWSIMIGGDFGGDDELSDLFFYDGEAGRGKFYLTDGSGGLEQLNSSGGFTTGWDLIIPGHFGSP